MLVADALLGQKRFPRYPGRKVQSEGRDSPHQARASAKDCGHVLQSCPRQAARPHPPTWPRPSSRASNGTPARNMQGAGFRMVNRGLTLNDSATAVFDASVGRELIKSRFGESLSQFRFDPVCGLKSDISRRPRSANSRPAKRKQGPPARRLLARSPVLAAKLLNKITGEKLACEVVWMKSAGGHSAM
jgi:hypothetical protein